MSIPNITEMQAAGKLAAQILDYIEPFIVPGVSTLELNDLCHAFTIEHGATSAPLNYRGFPKSICTSVNHVVCHGVPSEKKILKKRDIINIDVTPILNGWHGDTSRTFFVGKPSIKAKKLVEFTYEALMLGIEQVRPGNHVGDIGHAIQLAAEAKGYGIVEDYSGHGIGQIFHTEPNILHFGEAGTGDVFKPGMFFTIEPMINVGKAPTKTLADGWTVVTKDKSLSAQFEHTIVVTDDGYEILTIS